MSATTTLTMPKPTSDAAILAELALLRAENASLKAGKAGKMKVTEKGGMSLYGMGRFPVTLYKVQWIRLLDAADDIRKFLEENSDKLATKD